MMVKFGSIYYAGNMLIRYLCEHDTDILITSAFKMAELYRFIPICLHETSKKSIVFSPLLFSGDQSINQSLIFYTYLAVNRHNVPYNFLPLILSAVNSTSLFNISSCVDLFSSRFISTDPRSFSTRFIHVRLGLPTFLCISVSVSLRERLTGVFFI